MADKKEKPKKPNPDQIGEVQSQVLEDEMRTAYLDYAMSVIVSRALPDVRDGMKPVHRRILYAMWDMGIRPTSRFTKSAAVVGEVLGKYHPHSDAAVYDSMVRLAQPWATRYLLIDGQGNFGSMDGDEAGAMRYTEARLGRIATELLSDIEKQTVRFVPNYDGNRQEPTVLPAKLPNLLLNGSTGIAVGMATRIPPHNLRELVGALTLLIENPEAGVDELMEHVTGPDFPTGGTIYDRSEIKAAYATGRGKVVMRATAEIVEAEKGDFQIIVSELPYEVNKATLIEKIAELVKDKKITGISDLRDESDREGVRIVVDLKRDAYPAKILNQLYKQTPMQSAFHVNMLALVDGIQPRVLTLRAALEYYLKHRQEVVTKRTEYDLARAKERAHILEGLRIALDAIDAVIETIRSSKTRETAHENLRKKFKLSAEQATAILEMRLQTLAGLERQKIEDEYKGLVSLIGELEAILADPKKVLEVIRQELSELAEKFGDERKTRVIPEPLEGLREEDLVPNEQVIVTLTQGNYVKRLRAGSFRAQHRGGKGIVGMTTKEEDVVEHMVAAHNHDHMLFFTNRGRVFHLRVYEIPQGTRTSKGQAIVNLIQTAPDEVVTSLVTIPSFEAGEYLFMATKKGVVKKTKIKDYSVVRRSGLIAIRLDPGDELKWVKMTSGKDDVTLTTTRGQAVRFSEGQARPMGRATRGVRGIRLGSGDEVVGCDVAVPGAELVVITANGFGKRTDLALYPRHNRGGLGIRTAEVTKRTGQIISAFTATDLNVDIVIVSARGQVIRLPLSSVKRLGRATQGVTLIRMAEGDSVASVTPLGEMESDVADEVIASETQ